VDQELQVVDAPHREPEPGQIISLVPVARLRQQAERGEAIDQARLDRSNRRRESARTPEWPHFAADTRHNAPMGRDQQALCIPVQDDTVDIARPLTRPDA
jgi:hypothetical protein